MPPHFYYIYCAVPLFDQIFPHATENILLFDHSLQLQSSVVNMFWKDRIREQTHGGTPVDVPPWVCPEQNNNGALKLSTLVKIGYVFGQMGRNLAKKRVLLKYGRIAGGIPPQKI